tara:strand:- start:3139 stop:3276 length:138 start_codon:yes stop_codon:yes gene_type:complete
MSLFFHDVGLKGATADFHKAVFGEASEVKYVSLVYCRKASGKTKF